MGIWCVEAVCPYNPGPLYDFAAVIYSSTVTVEENVPPTVSTPAVSGVANGWIGQGAASAALVGSDTLGLRRLELLDGSDVAKDLPNACVDWSVLPCSEPAAGLGPGFSGTTSLASLPDGTHTLKARATDAAGNQTVSDAVTVNIDRTPPVAIALRGGGVSSAQVRKLEWLTPWGGSPITAARVKLCTSAGGCTSVPAGLEGPLEFDIGADGATATAQVELTDQAGNVATTQAVEFQRDATGPAAPGLALESATGPQRAVAVQGTEPGVSAYLLRVCSAGGCAEERRPPTGRVEVNLAAHGAYRLEVAQVDAVGNVGQFAAVAVDYPAPATEPPAESDVELRLKNRKLRKTATTLLIKGTTRPGSTDRVTVRLKGRPAGSKRNVTYKATAKVWKSGRWSVRLRLPRGVNRRHGVLVTATAKPKPGFAAEVTKRRVRR